MQFETKSNEDGSMDLIFRENQDEEWIKAASIEREFLSYGLVPDGIYDENEEGFKEFLGENKDAICGIIENLSEDLKQYTRHFTRNTFCSEGHKQHSKEICIQVLDDESVVIGLLVWGETWLFMPTVFATKVGDIAWTFSQKSIEFILKSMEEEDPPDEKECEED